MREKKKIMITAGIIAAVILVSLICINRGCKPVYAKSDDGKWKVCYCKSLLNDLWSGYLFYTGNYSGDTGVIRINTKIPDQAYESEEDDNEYISCEPQSYYKNPNVTEIIACGVQRKTTYFFADLIYGRPENVTIKIKWKENGKEYVSTIETD